MRIFNITKHDGFFERENNEIIEPSKKDKERIILFLTFKEQPTLERLKLCAYKLAEIAEKYDCQAAMINEPSYLMPILEQSLLQRGILPFYSFIESTNTNNEIIFRHAGWIAPFGMPIGGNYANPRQCEKCSEKIDIIYGDIISINCKLLGIVKGDKSVSQCQSFIH